MAEQSNNEQVLTEANNLLDNTLSKIKTYNMDDYISKKGLFLKNEYIDVYEAYYDYYSICLQLIDYTDKIEEYNKKLELIVIDSSRRIEENELKIKELEEKIVNMENKINSEKDDFEKDNLKIVLNNLITSKEISKQEILTNILVKNNTYKVKDISFRLFSESIPIWKKQVMLSIDIMVNKNKQELNKKLKLDTKLNTEVKKIKDATDNLEK